MHFDTFLCTVPPFGDFGAKIRVFNPEVSCDRRGAPGPPGDHRGACWGVARARLRSCELTILFFVEFPVQIHTNCEARMPSAVLLGEISDYAWPNHEKFVTFSRGLES